MGNKRPPLGLRPRFILVAERTTEILEAMLRYVREGYEIPQEWREELGDLLDDTDAWKEAKDAKAKA